jgi:predicted  nucleic acid-binding Zn-ribbon protein
MSEEIFESGTQDRPRPHPRGEAHVHQEESVSEAAVQDDASIVDDDEPEFNEEEFLQLRHKLALLNQDKDALERIADEMNKEVEKKQEIILDLRLRNATLTKAVKSVQQETEARDAVVNALYAEIDALKAQLARRVAYVPAYTRGKDEDDERSEAAPQPPKASAKTSAEEHATPLDSAVVSEVGTERAELLERVARLQMDMDRERKRRQEAEDTIEEAVSRVRELEREAAEHNAQDFVPPPLSNEIPEERGLTPMEQKHLFVRVIKLVCKSMPIYLCFDYSSVIRCC